MLVQGRCHKIGKQWAAEIPLTFTLVCTNPGESREDSLERLRKLALDHGLEMEIRDLGEDFLVDIHNIDEFLPLALKRLREIKKLSIGDVSKRLGHSSRNSYAQYEYKKTKLTVEKFQELVKAMEPQYEVVLDRPVH